MSPALVPMSALKAPARWPPRLAATSTSSDRAGEKSALRSRSIFLPHRREDIEVQDRLVADHLPPVHHIRRNLQKPAWTEHHARVADVKANVTGENVDQLLIGVLVRFRFVLGHQLVQRERRSVSGECLAGDAFAHRLPRNLLPVDLVQVHDLLHHLVSPRIPPGRMKRKISSTDSAATFFSPAPNTTIAIDWARPSMMPPAKAPSGWPKPPTIAAMKPDMANGTPTLKAVYWVGVISTPATAPRPADSANDSDSIRDTLMP